MNKFVKKILLAFLMFTISVLLYGCNTENPAKNAVNNMFTAFEKLDFETAGKYIDLEQIKFTENEGSITGNVKMYMQTLFDRLSHEIISEEAVDENTYKLKTKITAIDMEPVMINFFTKAMQYTFSSSLSEEKPSEQEMNQQLVSFFVESALDPTVGTVSNEVDITVINTEGKWLVQSDAAFINALFGNLFNALEKIENVMNGAE